MLKNLKVDNFKCLDGLDLKLGDHALLMGLNGTGKSTVVEVLERLRRFLAGGEKARDCFPRIHANAMVVVIDADRETVRHRQRQLDEALLDSGSSSRAGSERIAVLVPRRNIETWLQALLGAPTEEETDYKPLFAGKTAAACAEAGPLFAAFLQRAPSDADLPSLAGSRVEAARLT